MIVAETIALGSDHAGFALKEKIRAELTSMGAEVIDTGTYGTDSVDYPDYANKVAASIKEGKAEMGVLICGSGIGISIAANRHRHIRAALCHSEETARLARQHNNANVLALGARVIDEATAKACVRAFFATAFDGGRHAERVIKLGL